MRWRGSWTLVILSCLSVGLSGWGDTPDTPVARVSYSSGEASYLRGDDPEGGWVLLPVNTPLLAGDSVYAPEAARVEVDFGLGNVARLDAASQMDLLALSRDVTQLGVSLGRANLRVRGLPKGFTFEIDTPLAAAWVVEPGRFRVLVTGDAVYFDVLSGGLTAVVNGDEVALYPGESLEVKGGNALTYGLFEAPAPDAFDGWSEARDNSRDLAQSQRYVDAAVVGFEDLDSAGDWLDDPSYGEVWIPAGVNEEWAPYCDGSWIWQDPYGWTWVANEPWGWAPFHYGRWVYLRGFWAWVPPARPGQGVLVFYAPALVGFVGGPGWGNGIGWVCLGPGEPYYYPWQPAPPEPPRGFRNMTVYRAVTLVHEGQFGRGRVVPAPVEPKVIMKAPRLGTVLPGVLPTRASLTPRPEKRPSPRAIPPATVTNRPLVARTVPPEKPVPFTKKVEQIQVTGKPVPNPVPRTANTGKAFTRTQPPQEGSHVVSVYASPPSGRVIQVSSARPPNRTESKPVRPLGTPQQGGQGANAAPKYVTLPRERTEAPSTVTVGSKVITVPPSTSPAGTPPATTSAPNLESRRPSATQIQPRASGSTGSAARVSPSTAEAARPQSGARETQPAASSGRTPESQKPSYAPAESRRTESPPSTSTAQPRTEAPKESPKTQPVTPKTSSVSPAPSSGSATKKSDTGK
jgi:hypothetical protein